VLSKCKVTQSQIGQVYRTVKFEKERLFILNDTRVNNYVLHLHGFKKVTGVATKAVTVEIQKTCRLCFLKADLTLCDTIYDPPGCRITAGLSKVVLVNSCW
jgi:hypothetical protein